MTRYQASRGSIAVRAVSVLCGALLVPLATAPAASAADYIPCDTGRDDRDLNGDGFLDAVVGDPYATVNGQPRGGNSDGAVRRRRPPDR